MKFLSQYATDFFQPFDFSTLSSLAHYASERSFRIEARLGKPLLVVNKTSVGLSLDYCMRNVLGWNLFVHLTNVAAKNFSLITTKLFKYFPFFVQFKHSVNSTWVLGSIWYVSLLRVAIFARKCVILHLNPWLSFQPLCGLLRGFTRGLGLWYGLRLGLTLRIAWSLGNN